MAEKNEKSIEANEAPEGFLPVGGGGMQRWAIKAEGATVQGILVGYFTKRGKGKGSAYQVKLTKRTRAIFDNEEIVCEAGEIVCVDDTKALEDLRPLLTDGGEYEVLIKYIEKVKTDEGNNFWRATAWKKVLKAPPPRNAEGVPF